MQNGALLRRAAAKYDAFVTNGRGIPHQQNVTGLNLRVIVLIAQSNDITDLAPLVPQAEEVIRAMAPGKVRHAKAPRA